MKKTEEKISLKSITKGSSLTTSPTFKRRRADVELKIEKEKYENEYSTCCSKSGTTDARLIRYGSKFSLSILMLVFCFYQIMTSGECSSLLPWYTSIVSMILSVWLKGEGNIKPIEPNGGQG